MVQSNYVLWTSRFKLRFSDILKKINSTQEDIYENHRFCLLCCLAIPLLAAADISNGEKLFQSSDLGTNGKSGQTCHPKGKGLPDLSEFESIVLQDAINTCIEKALKGKPFAEGAQELQDLEDYMRQLGKK